MCCGGRIPSISQAIHGIFEISKTQLGIGVAPREVAVERVMICKECPFRTHVFKDNIKWAQCTKCNCLCAEKAQRASESCPEKKWLAIKI